MQANISNSFSITGNDANPWLLCTQGSIVLILISIRIDPWSSLLNQKNKPV